MLNNIKILLSAYAEDKNKIPLKKNTFIMINSYENFCQLLKTDYSQATEKFLNGVAIYRGVREFQGPYFVKIPGLRISQNTENSYTRLFSGLLPSWSKYPPRNKSFICTTNINRTRGYITESEYSRGQYIILPKNNAKIGVCSFTDMWDSFLSLANEYKIYDMSYLNWSINNFVETVSLKNEKFNQTFNDIKNMFLYNSDEKIKKFFTNLAKHTKDNFGTIII